MPCRAVCRMPCAVCHVPRAVCGVSCLTTTPPNPAKNTSTTSCTDPSCGIDVCARNVVAKPARRARHDKHEATRQERCMLMWALHINSWWMRHGSTVSHPILTTPHTFTHTITCTYTTHNTHTFHHMHTHLTTSIWFSTTPASSDRSDAVHRYMPTCHNQQHECDIYDAWM